MRGLVLKVTIFYITIQYLYCVHAQWNDKELHLPSYPRYMIGGSSAGELIYFGGGGDENYLYNIVDILNTTSFTWTNTTLSSFRIAAEAVTVLDRYIVFVGGVGTTTVTGIVDIFDTVDEKRVSFELDDPLYKIGLVAINELVIIAGGSSNGTSSYDSILSVNITSNPFNATEVVITKASMQLPRYNIAAFGIDNFAILAGGESDGMVTDLVEAIAYGEPYYVVTLKSLPMPLTLMGYTSAMNKYAFVAGGATFGNISSEIYIYDFEKNSWSTNMTLESPTVSMSATSLGELVFFAGGTTFIEDVATYSSTIYVYNIISGSLTTWYLTEAKSFFATVVTSNNFVFFAGGITDGEFPASSIDYFHKSCVEGLDPVCSDGVWCNGLEYCWDGECVTADTYPCEEATELVCVGGWCNEANQNCFAPQGIKCNTTSTLECEIHSCDGLGECVPTCLPQFSTADTSESVQNEPSPTDSKNSLNLAAILVPIFLVLALCVVGASVALFLYRRRRSFRESVAIELEEAKELGENSNYRPVPISSVTISIPLSTSTNYSKDLFGASNYEVNYDELILEKEIGSGAYGVVWKGKWREGAVAVKALKGLSESELNNFRSEIILMMSLRPHANVVQLLGVCTDPKKPLCIITEFVANGSLWDHLQNKNHTFEPSQVLKLSKGIVAGMIHLHMENIIHRDLAARNILLTSNFDAKVSDFGLARITAEVESGSQTVTGVGPLRWMSPESLVQKQYSVKSDVWSFGIVLMEMITRKLPYYEESDAIAAVTRLVLGNLTPTIHQEYLTNSIFVALNNIFKVCTKKDPQDRPTMKQIAVLLEKI